MNQRPHGPEPCALTKLSYTPPVGRSRNVKYTGGGCLCQSKAAGWGLWPGPPAAGGTSTAS